MTDHVPLLLSLFVVDMLAAMSPGPNFLVVTQSAIDRTPRHAAATVAGVVTANVMWCAAVVFGLAAVFELAPWLHGLIKLAGGAYLVYLGIQLWRQTGLGPRPIAGAPGGSLRGAYARGALTNLSNPKSVVYFGSVFALFLDPGTPVWVQSLAVGIVLVDTVLWYGAVAAFFSRARVRRGYRAVRRPLDRLAGTAMAVFGARLIVVPDE